MYWMWCYVWRITSPIAASAVSKANVASLLQKNQCFCRRQCQDLAYPEYTELEEDVEPSATVTNVGNVLEGTDDYDDNLAATHIDDHLMETLQDKFWANYNIHCTIATRLAPCVQLKLIASNKKKIAILIRSWIQIDVIFFSQND